MTQGLILFAHGARDPRWAEPFQAVADRVRLQRPALPLRLAFLELMQPSLTAAAAELMIAGCNCIAVLPLFLGAGGHVRRDLPALLDALRIAHPTVVFTLHRAAGEEPAVIDTLAAVALDHLR